MIFSTINQCLWIIKLTPVILNFFIFHTCGKLFFLMLQWTYKFFIKGGAVSCLNQNSIPYGKLFSTVCTAHLTILRLILGSSRPNLSSLKMTPLSLRSHFKWLKNIGNEISVKRSLTCLSPQLDGESIS